MKDIKRYFKAILEDGRDLDTNDKESRENETGNEAPKDGDVEESADDPEIESEEDFRNAARAKFEAAFGDELDEKKMNEVIDGILKDNRDMVDDGDWGALMGILNNSFSN